MATDGFHDDTHTDTTIGAIRCPATTTESSTEAEQPHLLAMAIEDGIFEVQAFAGDAHLGRMGIGRRTTDLCVQAIVGDTHLGGQDLYNRTVHS
jgi:hypothetical protein